MTSRHRISRGVLLAACLAAGAAAQAAEPPLGDPNQPYDELSMEVETPHVAWAKPSVTGPLEALVIAPCWQSRDSVELAQRLDVKVTPVMVSTNTSYHGAGEAMTGMDRALDELARLRLSDGRRYHVIVLGKVRWDALPAWVRKAIANRVVRGAGLVYVTPSGQDAGLAALLAKRDKQAERSVLDGVPVAMLPAQMKRRFYWEADAGATELRLSRYGQGRVAVVDYNDMDDRKRVDGRRNWAVPFTLGDGPWLDYYYAVVSRAMLWAARRELPILAHAATHEAQHRPTAVEGRASAQHSAHARRPGR